jgi:hypothetical protein
MCVWDPLILIPIRILGCVTEHLAVFRRVWKEGGTGFLYWGANCYEKANIHSFSFIHKLEQL